VGAIHSAQTGDAAPRPGRSFGQDLVGREAELARLAALAGTISAGHGQVVVLTGEAGIGKSYLAARVLADCAGQGFTVLSGVADEVEQRRPFGVVNDALGVHPGAQEGTRGAIARLLAHGSTADDRAADDRAAEDAPAGPGLEARIADLLVGLLADECRARPTALLLDDLQWADQSSLVAINGIARLVSAAPLLLICALREYPADGQLRALLAALDYRQAHRVPLTGMPDGEVAELAAQLAGAPPGPGLRTALGDAAGNPFYVSELISCLMKEGGASVGPEGFLELTAAGLPPSLRLTVLRELRFLPPPARDALRAAAVVGRVFSVGDVALISPGTVADVVAALDPAQQAGIIVPDGERLRFRHDVIREAVYDDLAPAVRTSLHRYLATRLAAAGAPLERVAAQLMLGATTGDSEAAVLLRRAAAEAAASSPAIAAALLGRAVDLVGDAAPQRRELLADLVRPLLWTGQAARAEQVCVEGLALHPPAAEEPLFWLGRADALLLQGRFADARAIGQDAMDRLALNEPDRLHLATVQALSGVYLGDPQGVELATRIVATAPASRSAVIAQNAIAQWELFAGRTDRALAAYGHAETLIDAQRESSPPRNRIWEDSGIRVRMWEGLALLDMDRIDEAADLLTQDISARLSVPALPRAFLAACFYHAGRLAEAEGECQAAVAAADAAGSFVPASALALAAVAVLRQGRLADAERLAAQAELVRTATEAAGDTLARWARVLLLEAAGETEQAADAAAAALAAYQRSGLPSYLAWHAPDLVRVALRAGRRDQARLAVRAAELAAAQLPTASRRAGALRARGLLTGDAATLLAAVAAGREVARPLDLAHALRDAAAALASAGDRAAARPLAAEAVELLGELGAVNDDRVARAMLRAAGLAVSARARHIRSRHGWDSLTEAELRVVRLAALGHSNLEIAKALYLSPRTVGWHLSNAFRKLGLTSRTELAAEALRREATALSRQ
jgi:DNA-binding CsgD family transcriptional regulator